jgi:predicted O-methyltransferase YrrM
MSEALWNEVDRYFESQLLARDSALEAALEASDAAGLPEIAVSPSQGKLLHLLAVVHGATRILEVGTLGGYSGIWLARALPAGGRLVTLELNPHHAETARSNFARAGLTDRVEQHVGPALYTLTRFEAERIAPFDLTFIDADKPNNLPYVQAALALSRPGALIVVDNVVREGAVVSANPDASSAAVRRMTEWIGREPRLSATVIQTVGSKGHDGFLVARVSSLRISRRSGTRRPLP